MGKDAVAPASCLMQPHCFAPALRAVWLAGRMRRNDLPRAAGMPAAEARQAAAALIRERLLVEDKAGPDGAPALRLNVDGLQVIGVVVGVESTEVVAMDPQGKRLPDRAATFESGPDYLKMVSRIGQHAKKIQDKERRTIGLGVTLPGQVDEVNGRVFFSPNMHQMDGRHVAANLSRASGLPVVCIHEVRALCAAERMFGQAANFTDFACLHVTTGVGGGLALSGRIFRGRDGSAGEFGHITANPDGPLCGCGNRGCIEVMASNRAVTEAVSRKLGRKVTIEEAIAMCREGNAAALKIVKGAFDYLGIALAAIINAVNPQAVFVSAKVCDALEDPIALLREKTDPRALPSAFRGCLIQRCSVDEAQGAVAAVVMRLIDLEANGPLQAGVARAGAAKGAPCVY